MNMQMSAGQQLEIAARLKQLWKGLLPTFQAPTDEQFLSWAQLASEEIICHAFNRGRKKAYQERMAGIVTTDDSIGRFVTGVIVRERKCQRLLREV
jgi:hypothetical protein